jgi:hypothetical protein
MNRLTYNCVLLAIVAAVAAFGAYNNAWEASFDSLSSTTGFSSPSARLDNVAFLDEFAGSMALFVFLLSVVVNPPVLVLEFPYLLGGYMILVAVVNRSKDLEDQKWFPPFHYEL